MDSEPYLYINYLKGEFKPYQEDWFPNKGEYLVRRLILEWVDLEPC